LVAQLLNQQHIIAFFEIESYFTHSLLELTDIWSMCKSLYYVFAVKSNRNGWS